MTTIPCPENLPWCTDHVTDGSVDDEMHRHVLRHSPVVEISQNAGERVLVSVSWDTDSDDTVEVRQIGQLIVSAADLVEAIEEAEYTRKRLSALTTKVWERKAGVFTPRAADVANAERVLGVSGRP